MQDSIPIDFESSVDQTQLHGTLSGSGSKRRAPVLMLTGSGKVDRDETTPGNLTFSRRPEKLFRQLSDALVRAGYVTYRYDKRGVLNESGDVDRRVWETADRNHLLSDAVDAARLLMTKSQTRPEDLIILGHSEGTIIAVETALALGGKVKALLLLGVQARSMQEMLHYQIVQSHSKRTTGAGESGSPETEYKKALERIKTSTGVFAPDDKPLAWYRQYLASPANEERIAKVDALIAVFQGDIDPQTPRDEVDRLKRVRGDLVVYRYPNLGHGFSPDLDGKPTLGPIDERVLADLVQSLARFIPDR